MGVDDPRRKKPKYPLKAVWRSVVLSLCMMKLSVRSATEYASGYEGKLLCGIRRTALADLLSRLDVHQVREVLRCMVRTEHRRKALRPVGLPFGVVSIDGRTNWTGDEEVNEFCQKSHRTDESRTPYWSFRVVRAVLVSAAAKVCIDETPIPADTNDMGVFASFFKELEQTYGRSDLFEAVTCDAGFCSEANARLVDEHGYTYVFALKDNQPELYREARRVLEYDASDSTPEARTHWEMEKGRMVQRRLWRTTEMAGWLDWTHLRQVWLVRKVARDHNDHEHVIEDRYFVTNQPVNRLKPVKILDLVRRHWGVENNCFWTMDTQFKEDSGFWVRKGNGLLICSLLRAIAYNIVTLLRAVHLKSKTTRKSTWKTLAERFQDYVFAVQLDRSLEPKFV